MTGLVLDRFRIGRRLGGGSFGEVFESEDTVRGGMVALKRLSHVDDRTIFRFKREFRAIADMRHENLVGMRELIAIDGTFYLVMELIEGKSFLEYVRTTARRSQVALADTVDLDVRPQKAEPASESDIPEGVPDAVRLRSALRQLVAGVRALHAAGKIHRDLKPENVLVEESGRVVILDFGLVADATDTGDRLAGTRCGTPRYMAPEQLSEGKASEASDWYAVGVMLYEVITGRSPPVEEEEEEEEEEEDADAGPPSDRPEPADLLSLAKRMLAKDDTARPTGAEIAAIVGARGRENTASLPPSPFVGRATELELLRTAFAELEEGRLAIAHVHGESGMGKTTLVKQFLDEIRRTDAMVLEGRCHPNESLPFNALDELVDRLARLLESLPRLELEAVLPRDAQLLAASFPVLGAALARAPERPRATSPVERRRRAFAAMRELISRLSDRRRLVLHLDDLQWADADSAAMLEEMLRSPDPPSLLLVASYRDEAAEGALAWLRARTAGARHVDVPVRPLLQEDSLALATMLGAEDRAPALARDSGGSPLLLQFMSRSASPATPNDQPPSSGPALVASALLSSLDALPRLCLGVLDLLAVAVHPLSPDVVADALGVDRGEARGALDALVIERLARRSDAIDPHTFLLVHDRVRDALLERVRATEQAALHRTLGLALERSEDADVETLAQHFHEAGDRERTFRYASEAAARAMDAFAFHRAVRSFSAAIAAAPDDAAIVGELETRFGDALTFAGRATEAADAYLAAAGRVTDRQYALELRRRAAQQLLFAGRFDRGVEEMRHVLEQIGLSLPKARLSGIPALLAHRAMARLRGLSFTSHDEADIAPEDLLRIDICRSATIGLGLVDVVRSAELQTRHLQLALRAGEPVRVARALGFEALSCAAGGNHNTARTRQVLVELDKLVERLGDEELRGVAAAVRGGVAYLEGDFAAVPEMMTAADPLFALTPTEIMHYGHDSSRVVWLASLHWLGRFRDFIERAELYLEEADHRKNVYVTTYLQSGIHSITWLAKRGPEEARRRADAAIAPWSQEQFHVPHLLDAVARAELAMDAGDIEGAYTGAAAAARNARRALLGRCQYFRTNIRETWARASLAAKRTDEALTHAAALEAEQLAWAKACALLIRAGADRLRGRPEDSVATLERAIAGFEALGMELYVAVARQCLGRVVGGEAGRAHIARAAESFTHAGVLDPPRFVRLLAPGFAD